MSINDRKKDFTLIYEAEHDALFRFCLFRVSDREKALDITQESFARLWIQMLGNKGEMESSRAFLFTVARHLIVDWYRKKKTLSLDASYTSESEDVWEPADERGASEIEASSDAKRVTTMISKLPPQYRDVVYLRFVEDLPPRDIAQILRLSTGVVSVRITRGIQELRRMLGINNT